MRLLSIAAATFVCCIAGVPAHAMHGGGMNGGMYSSSAMAVQRERQEKARICAGLRPHPKSGIVSYVDRGGRRVICQ